MTRANLSPRPDEKPPATAPGAPERPPLADMAAPQPQLAARLARFRAWMDLIFADHGFIRLVYLNRHRVGTGALWRAAQPAPGDFRRFAAEGGRTVVNLRGGREMGAWPLEQEACHEAGLTLVELPFRTRLAPARETVRAAADLFARIEYPALIHCKSGADRAGFGAALYLILREGRTVAEAKRQLRLVYGHMRASRAGILDAFLDRYRDEGEAKGKSLLDWVEQDYDPEALKRDFRPQKWASLFYDWILRRE
ncbi:sulfur transferase domain-containing protein [Pseudoxanthobacter sp.]|uniref:fused DSP-PTPase phosphatase/NAD kinase-like protein n=1 Tax=Pseudoxanthobacter sp. TaxID=1925742 RepID=UPI002FE2FAD8